MLFVAYAAVVVLCLCGCPPSLAARAPSFPDVFSATRLISEPGGQSLLQPGYVRSNYTAGWHLSARSVDNVTFDEGVKHVAAQAAWTVWRDVKSGEETRPCTGFAFTAPIAHLVVDPGKTKIAGSP